MTVMRVRLRVGGSATALLNGYSVSDGIHAAPSPLSCARCQPTQAKSSLLGVASISWSDSASSKSPKPWTSKLQFI